MSKDEKYPIYQYCPKSGLMAFISKDKMFRVLNIGSNVGNQGVTLDRYTTRKMVLKHNLSSDYNITEGKFIELYNKIYKKYLDIIIQ